MSINQERIRQTIDFVLNRLLIVFFFAVLIIYASREVADLDIWLHLKTGEFIVGKHIIPMQDIFSFTIKGKPWINHEWLFQALAYLFYSRAGWDGLICMQNIALVAAFGFLLKMGLREKNHIFVFLVLYITLLTAAYRFTIRPDIFSLFFLSLYLYVLNQFSQTRSKLIWLLPVLQVFWINMHGFSFTGPLIVLLFLFGEIIKRTIRLPYEWNNVARLDNRQIFNLLAVFGLMILASFVNPYGLKGAAYPFSVLGQISGKGKVVFQYIEELAKPIEIKNIFNFNRFMFFKAYILLSLFSFRYNQKRINITELILWISFLLFSLIAIRNISYFAIVAAYCTFSNVARRKEPPFKNLSARFKILSAYACIAFLFYYPAKGALNYLESSTFSFDTYKLKSGLWGISQDRYPKKAVDFILKNNFPKNILNDFNSGSYLIGQTHPKRLVFIDGRTELYGPDFFINYVAVGEGKKGVIEKTVSRYDIKGFFLTTYVHDLHANLVRYLYKSPLWKCVYFDEAALIFLKDIKENSDLINKYRIDLKAWVSPKPDFLKIGVKFRYPSVFLTRARILNILGCYEASEREAKIALDIMPNNAEALKFMSDAAFEQKNYAQAFRYARNSLIYSGGALDMRSRLALIYHYLNNDDKALKVIDSIIKNAPKFAEAYYVKSQIIRDHDRKNAKELLRQAVKLSSKDPKYHAMLGDLLALDKDLAAAKKEWGLAFEYDGSNETLKKKLLIN